MKSIEITNERSEDKNELTMTVTVTFIQCSCGFSFPQPLLSSGGYIIQCPVCRRNHRIEVEE